MAMTQDRTMSDSEGLMWRLERDPHMTSNIALVALLDRAPDMTELRQRLERATYLIPRLRHRVKSVPGNLAPPVFEPDPSFDFDTHVRHIALPAPGRKQQLFDLVAQIALDPFETQRPLWQVTVVEGLKRGHAAVILKAHHTITDGEGGVQLALHLVDLERNSPSPPMPTDEQIADAEGQTPRTADTVREVVNQSLRIPAGISSRVRELLADPTALPDAGASTADSLRGLVEQLTDTDAARSPLWTTRSLSRRFHVGRAPIAATRAASRALGGTLNTAFVTLAAEAASRYHVEMGAPTDSLRASMAVSTRTEESGANAFSLVRMIVPTAEMPIDERFRAVQASIGEAMEQAATGALEAVSALSAILPTPVIARLARQQTQTIDFATSNVRGAPVPVYVAGAKLLRNYPVGPTVGSAFNLTLLSYRKSLDMGLNIDAGAVAEPKLLARLLDDSVSEFTALGD